MSRLRCRCEGTLLPLDCVAKARKTMQLAQWNVDADRALAFWRVLEEEVQ